MGLMGKLFGRQDEATTAADAGVECPHKALTARWDSNEDMGKEDRATGFRCESCGENFSGDEGRQLLHSRVTLAN